MVRSCTNVACEECMRWMLLLPRLRVSKIKLKSKRIVSSQRSMRSAKWFVGVVTRRLKISSCSMAELSRKKLTINASTTWGMSWTTSVSSLNYLKCPKRSWLRSKLPIRTQITPNTTACMMTLWGERKDRSSFILPVSKLNALSSLIVKQLNSLTLKIEVWEVHSTEIPAKSSKDSAIA